MEPWWKHKDCKAIKKGNGWAQGSSKKMRSQLWWMSIEAEKIKAKPLIVKFAKETAWQSCVTPGSFAELDAASRIVQQKDPGLTLKTEGVDFSCLSFVLPRGLLLSIMHLQESFRKRPRVDAKTEGFDFSRLSFVLPRGLLLSLMQLQESFSKKTPGWR